MILIIDNYDSFTYNLYQCIGSMNSDVSVIRNDRISIEEIERLKPSHMIISPGPGFPATAGISVEAIQKLHKHIPILGVCLGHQAIGEAFGGEIIHAKELFHGKPSDIHLKESLLFTDMPKKIKGARYHSLIVKKESLPKELDTIAFTDDGEIMGIAHKEYPVFGIQFHPESIITEHGMDIIRNFLAIA